MLIYGLIVYSLKPRDAEPLPEQLPGDSRLQRIRSNRCYIFASMIGDDVGENFPQKSQLSTLRVGFPWLRLSECRQDWPESGCGHWKAQTPTMEETVDFGQIERSKEKADRLDGKISHIIQDNAQETCPSLGAEVTSMFFFSNWSVINAQSWPEIQHKHGKHSSLFLPRSLIVEPEQLCGASVHEVNEDYTSKACSSWGKWNMI